MTAKPSIPSDGKRLLILVRTLPLRYVAIIALLLLILFIRWEMVTGSIASLILSLASIVAHPLDAWTHIRSDSIRYWIAAATWCAIAGVSIRALFHRSGFPGKAQKYLKYREYLVRGNEKKSAEERLGHLVLAGFIIVSLIAPYLTPLKPDEQGDLSTTRFASPLSMATCWSFVPNDEACGGAQDRLLDALDHTNHRLLQRKTVFTCGTEIPAGVARSEAPYSIVLLFGTDELGRDIFSRVVEGAKVSLGIGLLVAFASVCLGTLFGFLSSMSGRLVDSIIMRLIDIILAIPSLFLIIAVLSFLGGSVWVVILVLTLTGWMGVARLVRAEILRLRESEYVLTARMVGVSMFGIMKSHLLPNVLPTILTASVLQLVNAILGESALSFLGLGVQPPTPSWGNMLGESVAYLSTAWWIGVFPGLALTVLIVAVHSALSSFKNGWECTGDYRKEQTAEA